MAKSKKNVAPVVTEAETPVAPVAAAPVAAPTQQVDEGSDDAENPNAVAGDNTGWSKKKAIADVFRLGEAEARGQVSRTEIARTLVRAASELSDVSSQDAAKFYQAYARGKAKNPDAVYEAKDATKSEEIQTAKLGVWLRLGELPPSAFGGRDAVETFDHINDTYKNLKKSGEKLPQSRFDSIQAVARKWIKTNTKPADGKYRPLTQDEIDAIILPSSEKEKKDDWQKLASIVRSLEGLEEITSDKRASSIIEDGSTVGATFGALVQDLKRLFTDAGRADLVAPKEAKKAAEAVAFLTEADKRALLARLQAELSA